jgi:hypothetical protein
MFTDGYSPNRQWIIENREDGVKIKNDKDGTYICYDEDPAPGSVCRLGTRASLFSLQQVGHALAVKIPGSNLAWAMEGELNELHLEEEKMSPEQWFKFIPLQ